MYIELAFKSLHDLWRYLVGVLLIFIAWQIIGGVPLIGALVVKMVETGEFPREVSQMIEILGSNLFLFLMLLSFVIGLFGLFIVVKILHKQTILKLTTSRKKIDWKRVWFAFIFWGIISSGMVLGDYYFNPESYVNNFNLQPFLILCVIAILLVPLQTSFEEYLFRGYLMQGIGILAKNKWLPLIITSSIFGLMHIANPEIEKLGYIIMVYYIGTGFFLGITTLMDEGLELSLGFHAANNLFIILLVTADWTAFQTHSILKDNSDPSDIGFMEIFFPVFVLFPILLLVFSKKYNWTNWKDKLFGAVVKPVEELDKQGEILE